MNNWNCEGSGPHCAGEVRLLPLGSIPDHGNLILCRNCFNREIAYRDKRNLSLAPADRFQLPAWDSLKVYGEEAA